MKKFGHYEVTSELGRGGMGVVYKGFEPSLNRKVAIKCLAKHLLDDKDLVERFTREAKATAALNDPNVIQIYYIGKEEGQPFFAMEYIEGESLDDILKGGNTLSVGHAKNILKQACLGLAAAHKLELVHRDIKPANIMITKNGTLKIVDFGIARTREYGDKLTNTGEFVGTPGYLSPEVCIGKDVDSRSDIFSLGIVFYEMLAGKVPFENDSPLGLMLEVVQSDIPDIRGLNKKVDKKTSYILNKMIAKSPDDRYQTCEDIIRDLGNVIDKQSIAIIRKDSKTVYHQKTASKVSEQVTLPGSAAVTTNNLTALPRAKSSKKWMIAATLFAVIGAGAVGYYNGYLPFPKTSGSETTVALVDENLLVAGLDNPVDNSTPEQTDTGNNATASSNSNPDNSTTENLEGTGLISGLSNMFSNDTKDVAQVDNSGEIDFPNQQSETLTAGVNTTTDGQNQSNPENAGFNIDVQPTNTSNQVANQQPETNANTNTNAIANDTSTNGTTVVTLPAQSDLNSLAHNTNPSQNGLAETKMHVPPVTVDSSHAIATQVVKQTSYQAKPLNKGVVVIAFGDPAIANPVEKILESQLKLQGIKVMNEQFIPGMRRLVESGLDLAELKNLIEKNGGQAMIIANVNYVGSQQLIYAGRSTELVNAQLDIDTYDIKTGDSIGVGYGSKINYTSINATDQASDAIMQFTDKITSSLKGKI